MSARTDQRHDAPAWISASTAAPTDGMALKKTRRAPTNSELRFEERGVKRGLAVGFLAGGLVGLVAGALVMVIFLAFRAAL